VAGGSHCGPLSLVGCCCSGDGGGGGEDGPGAEDGRGEDESTELWSAERMDAKHAEVRRRLLTAAEDARGARVIVEAAETVSSCSPDDGQVRTPTRNRVAVSFSNVRGTSGKKRAFTVLRNTFPGPRCSSESRRALSSEFFAFARRDPDVPPVPSPFVSSPVLRTDRVRTIRFPEQTSAFSTRPRLELMRSRRLLRVEKSATFRRNITKPRK